MRCVLLNISIVFLAILAGCSRNDKTTYIYEEYKVSGELLNDRDTIILEKKNGGVFNATVYMHGSKKDFKVEQRDSLVKLNLAGRNPVLYSTRKDTIYENAMHEDYNSPYFVNNTRFLKRATYHIDNRTLSVLIYRINNFSTDYSFVYYSPEFGFVCYTEDKDSYKKLANIINVKEHDRNLAMKLVNAIIRDSVNFIYPYYPKPGSMKFSPPSTGKK